MALAMSAGDDGRRELADARQQRGTALVGLADDARPARRVHVVEKAHELVFDEAALLFDDEDVGKPVGEA